jgi:hypothetical protein
MAAAAAAKRPVIKDMGDLRIFEADDGMGFRWYRTSNLTC